MTVVCDVAQVERALRLIVVDGATFEIRAPITDRGRESILFGYFMDPARAAREINKSCRNATAVYVTLNPVRPELRARCADRLMTAGKGSTTSDNNIVKRTRLLIDIDGVPASKISASNAEHDAAIALAFEIHRDLLAQSWPEPTMGDSGNGAHLVYAIDLPAEDDTVGRFLDSAHARWGRTVDGVTLKIDPQNRNPARITKVYGTWARKGDDMPDRPHRLASIISAPDVMRAVTREQLEAFIAAHPPIAKSTGRAKATPPRASTASSSGGPRALDVGEWLARYGIAVRGSSPWASTTGPGTMHELEVCPFNADHNRGEAHVEQHGSGAISAGCQHQTCQWTWADLRAKYDPIPGYTVRDESGLRDPDPTAKAEWPTPQPLGDHRPPVPVFDTEILPTAFRAWVRDVAERMQVPAEMVAVHAMCALSSVAASARTIHPKRFDPWRVHPVLWGIAVAPPGAKKTPSMSEAMRPLKRLEELERKRWAADEPKRNLAALEAKFKRDAAEKRLQKAVKDGDDFDRNEMARSLEIPEELTRRERRFIAEDTTIEKIPDLVNRRGEGQRSYPIAVVRDELIAMFQTFERDGREADRSFYLEGWNVSDKRTDRVTRGEVFVRDLCLIVFGNATPGAFEAHVRDATKASGSDGFLQRLQLMVYPDPITNPVQVDRPADRRGEARAFEVFERLAAIDEDDDRGRPPALRFDDEAQPIFDRWLHALDLRLAQTDDHPALVSHFSKYRSLMPALALVCHLASEPGAETMPVSALAAQQAIAWCDYLEAHARRVYTIAANPERALAAQVIKRIHEGKLTGETTVQKIQRDISAETAPPVHGAMELLEELGWCRLVEVRQPGKPGRPSMRVTINPRARAA